MAESNTDKKRKFRNSKDETTLTTTEETEADAAPLNHFPNTPLGKATVAAHLQVIRAKHHVDILSKHKADGTFPNGLTIKKAPQVPTKPATLLLTWEETLNACSRDLVNALATYWDNQLKEVTTDFDSLMTQVGEKSSEQEKEIINNALEKQKETANAKPGERWQRNQKKQGGLRKNIVGFFRKKYTRK